MFSAYQVKNVLSFGDSKLEKRGIEQEQIASSKTRESLELFLSPTGSVNAELMMSEWFPEEKFDVFISHSRADKNLALGMLGWLEKSLGVTAFIDSCVWSHADKLLREMDNKWCYQSGKNTYSYESRNITTMHVHMMLAAALTKMMDQCECILFLNTNNSVRQISSEEMVQSGSEMTQSPWLFHEIAMMNLLRRKKKSDHRVNLTNFSENVEKGASARVPDFKYPANLEGIPSLSVKDLNEWQKKSMEYRDGKILTRDYHPLDLLYGVKSPDVDE